ncbi:unnamed protein product [Periconia digitata]|uniref:Fungal lipase-type domain-containing protein n=1 Tax=Periconia digitata TaxID=1303443 RepID=A0A9W4XGJ7_9PLEO|nr:unnamed protein product [Periconia digitata]
MPLVELQDGPWEWWDIKDAADILWRSTLDPDIHNIASALQSHYQNPQLEVTELITGINASRRGIVVCNGEKITIAFLGCDSNELHMNMWVFAKGPSWWDIPYPVYENGHQVHSFFRDMWHAMRIAAYDAINMAVESMAARGSSPKQIIITGFSMGGGISILAFSEILERIRNRWGSGSDSPQPWAKDENLGSLVQHLTFAAVSAGDFGYYSALNRLYEKHHIRAWDFFNHRDITVHIHHIQFRTWRGHRYTLPEAVVRPFSNEFGGQGHNILGYLKAAEWMCEHGTDQVKSEYRY